MTEWLTRNVARIALGLGALLLILTLLWLRSCEQERGAKAQATLTKNQATAAAASGEDAVNTVGNRMSADAATDDLTRSNGDAIHNAPGASAPVSPGLSDAALRGLCRRVAYRNDPKCVQYADPR